ncbi:MAG: glycosyltransferase [Methyloprofundus sp.]|nr:glycosyltransferase [Methyloprofundus sp.]
MSKNTPHVTIVIPLYNVERYIASTLDSVLQQSWQDLEIIIVNDGSTDRSMAICQQFDDPRIRYVEQPNGGLAAARNAGIDHARGEYIGFIDADDIWYPEKVSRHLEHFASDPELGLSYSYSSLMDEEGKDVGVIQKEGTAPTTFADCYIRNVIGNGSNALLRREVFNGRGTDLEAFPPLHAFDIDLRHAEDYELWSRIAALTQWKMVCIPEVLVWYRLNPNGLSANTQRQRHYHLLATAKIAGYAPVEAEKYRTSSIAHLYWHQARTYLQQKNIQQGAKAVRSALHYNWHTLTGNHVMIGSALITAKLLPEWLDAALYRYACRIWGGWQRLQLRLTSIKKDQHSSLSVSSEQLSEWIRPPESYVREKAMPNLFFLSHKHQLMFLGLSKNASSSLKQLFQQEEFGTTAQTDSLAPHKFWGWTAQPGRSIEVGDTKSLEIYSSYRRFAVYRDPLSRFLSAYHNKVIYASSPHPFYIDNRLEGMGLDHFINVTAEILKIENPLHIDEHLRPQAWCYQPDDVDYIVPIKKLSQFLLTEFGIQMGTEQNKTTLPKITPTDEQCDRIRKLYQCDYAIKPNWPPR